MNELKAFFCAKLFCNVFSTSAVSIASIVDVVVPGIVPSGFVIVPSGFNVPVGKP